MKKTILGIGFILGAGLLLFKDYIDFPAIGMPMWRLLLMIWLGLSGLHRLLRRDWQGSFIFAVISFILLNGEFQWLKVSTFTIVAAAILLNIGFSILFKPKRFSIKVEGGTEADTIFRSGTRYVTDEDLVDLSGDVVFGSSSIYVDNATMLGDKATYSGDTVFSSVRLYVPKNWRVDFTGERVFSSVTIRPNPSETTKTLIITGDVVFSSFEVIYI